MFITVVTNGRYNRGNFFRFPVGARDFFLRQSIQTDWSLPSFLFRGYEALFPLG